jgi:aspartate aminotransferase, cytoplasmic
VQTISGTGAHALGAEFAKKLLPETSGLVYVGTPAWGNYVPLFTHTGLEVVTYRHYDAVKRRVDFQSILSTMREAPRNSLFVLQGCCHNPTGMNMNREQWQQLAQELRERGHFPFFGNHTLRQYPLPEIC